MKLIFHKKFSLDARTLVRRCGYGEIYDRRSEQTSYVRRIRAEYYPRFHLYINKEEPGELILNLHLDAKKPSYEGQTAHSGEYEGEIVEREAARIKQIVAGWEGGVPKVDNKNKGGLVSKIFKIKSVK